MFWFWWVKFLVRFPFHYFSTIHWKIQNMAVLLKIFLLFLCFFSFNMLQDFINNHNLEKIRINFLNFCWINENLILINLIFLNLILISLKSFNYNVLICNLVWYSNFFVIFIELQGVCPICLKELKTIETDLVTTPCFHPGCRTCLEKWIEQVESCPVCRKKITAPVLRSIAKWSNYS